MIRLASLIAGLVVLSVPITHLVGSDAGNVGWSALASAAALPAVLGRDAAPGQVTDPTKRPQNVFVVGGVQLARSNSWITDVPTLQDEYPFGITLERKRNIVDAKPPFKGVCGISLGNGMFIYGIGKTAGEKHTLIFMGGIKIPVRGGMHVCVDDKWVRPDYKLPFHYDGGKKYPAPTIYTDPSGSFVLSTTYHYPEPRWTYQVLGKDGRHSLVIEMRTRGVPFWLGKATGPYTAFGIGHPEAPKTLNVWGGFIWFGSFTAKLKTPQHGELVFKGWGVKDREYHRAAGPNPRRGHHPASYTAVAISQGDGEFDLIIYDSFHPLTGENWSHHGRLNFPKQNLNFRFDDYEYRDDGTVNPKEYSIKGRYERGEVSLTGKVEFWRGHVAKRRGWQSSFIWPYIHWQGTIRLDRKEIKVDTLGLAELSRLKKAH